MKRYPVFVLLFAIYPSLALLLWNFREVDPRALVRPLVFSLCLIVIASASCWLLMRSLPKALLVSTILGVFFFSFGHLSIAVEELRLGTAPGTFGSILPAILPLTVLLILVFLCSVVLRSKRDFGSEYAVLNVVSAFLVLSSGFMLSNRYLAQSASPSHEPEKASKQGSSDPDIYYIILDAYGRQDSLQTLGYDNSIFIDELENLGFYVASCSRSNYPQTVMSIASSLNMNYLWDAVPNLGPDDRDAEPVYASILDSRVRRELESRGYEIIAFDSGANWLNWSNADRYLEQAPQPFFATHLHPFEYLFLETTALRPLMRTPFFLRNKYVHNYERILFTLDALPEIAREHTNRPKFVYAHMLIPHRPNIFLPDGSINTDTDFYAKGVGEGINRLVDIEGYINNTKFINRRLPGVIREILQQSKSPPIIIVQGDHGYQLPDIRFDILNAYYFPDGNYASLYREISPVNTFRVIFTSYLDEEYPLLKDESINVGINRPYGKKKMRPAPCP